MKKALVITLKIALSVGLLWFLSHTSKLSFHSLTYLFSSPSLLVYAILLYLAVVLISTWRWHQLNKAQGIHLSFSYTIIPTYLGIAFNNLLPGGVGGDFFRGYFLFKKTHDKKSAAMLSILFDRVTGLMGIFITVSLVVLFNIHFLISQKNTIYFIFICLFICAGLFILFFTSSLLPKKLGLSYFLQQRFAGKKWLNPILSLLNAMSVYRHSKLIIMKCLLASVVIQVMIALTCLLIAKILHFPAISFFDYVIAIAVTQIVNLIPITPGGFGMGEAAFAHILLLLNPHILASYATIFLAYRIIGILVYLPGLAVFIFDSSLLKQNYGRKLALDSHNN